MKRRQFFKTVSTAGLALSATPAWFAPAASLQKPCSTASKTTSEPEQASPETILLKDYKPRSLYKIPITEVPKAKFPIIDMHSHPYAKTPQQIESDKAAAKAYQRSLGNIPDQGKVDPWGSARATDAPKAAVKTEPKAAKTTAAKTGKTNPKTGVTTN